MVIFPSWFYPKFQALHLLKWESTLLLLKKERQTWMFRKSNWRTHRKEACILMKVEKIALNLWVYQQLNFFQNCNCVSFSPVPTATPTKSVTNEGQTIATVHPQPQPDDETIIHPSHCAAGYSDGTIRIFDLGKVEMVMKMQPHAAAVTAIAFSSFGKSMRHMSVHFFSKNIFVFLLVSRFTLKNKFTNHVALLLSFKMVGVSGIHCGRV